MHLNSHSWRQTLSMAVLAVCASSTALAQSWPQRPIKVVIPFPPGGPTDLVMRTATEKIQTILKQPVVIENQPGAGGNIGAATVARAAPDGYTFLFATDTLLTVNPHVYKSMPFKLDDLKPISVLSSFSQTLVCNPSLGVKTVSELIAKSKTMPLSYASGGAGVPGHLSTELLLSMTGMQMTHIPYKSGAEVLRELMSGTLEVGWVDTTTGGAAAKADKIRLLGISGTIRVPGNPDIKTLQEQGYGLDLNGWLGLFARAGTPDAIVTAINNEVLRIMNSEEAQSRLTAMNIGVFPANTPEQYAQTVQRDLQAWKKIIVDNNIKAE